MSTRFGNGSLPTISVPPIALGARIAETTDRLADFPESGTPRSELGPGLRSLVVGHYLVLYRVGPDSVDIVRVVHGARELRALI